MTLKVVAHELAFVCLFAGFVSAQTAATGLVAGTVRDETGGVIVGAAISLAPVAGEPHTGTTDGQGRYRFERMPPGRYTLIVDAPGFLKHQSAVDLRPNGSVVRDISLDVGVAISVDVSEPADLAIDSRKSLSALTLTRKEIDALPDDPRQFVRRLIEMAGGSTRGDVAIYVDGFRNYRRLPPKSVIDTIRINSNPFSAEFAQQSVRRIEITTKPGSDGFHGDGTLQARSNRLNARNPLAGTKPQGQYRNFNGYLQGPVKKGRAGFLVYAGQWRQDDNANVHATILDPESRAPTPFLATVQTPAIVTSGELKLDFRIAHNVFTAAFGRTVETHRGQGLSSGFDLPERAYDRRSTDSVGRFSWTTLGRHSIHDVRVEVTQTVGVRAALIDAPAVMVLDAFNGGGNQNAASRSTGLTVQASDTLTVVRGRHVMKTGVQLETVDLSSVDRSGFSGTFTFGADVERDASGSPVVTGSGLTIPISPLETYARTLRGLPGYAPSQFVIVAGNPNVGLSQWNAGVFALDDWSISKRVSLSYGIRAEAQNNLRFRVNLAPRGALSLLLDAKGKNALKMGAGIFNTRVDSDLTLETHKLDGSRQQQFIVPHPSFFTILPPAFEQAAAKESTTYTKSDSLRMPMTFATTTTYERALASNIFAAAQYLFGRGFDQLRLRNTSAAGQPPVFQFESSGRYVQHELMLIARGTIGARLDFQGNYRLGRRDSDTDGAYTLPGDSRDLAAEFGPSAVHRRHQLTAGMSVRLPGGIRLAPGVTLRSGRPFNITTGRDNNGDSVFTDRPAFAKAGDPGAVSTPFGVFNPNPKPGDVVIPRNFGHEPRQVNVNLVVSKTLLKALTVTGDAENLFNNRRFFAMNGVLTSPVFGRANQALSARRFELTIRYGF